MLCYLKKKNDGIIIFLYNNHIFPTDYNKLVLSEKKGAAFVAFPASGTLKPFEEQVVEITAHSDMWGIYQDNVIFKVNSGNEK